MSRVDPNQAEFGAADLASLFGARLDPAWRARGVTTDSRADVRGTLFVALEGERFDGHRFAAAVLAAGAAAVVVRAGHPALADPALTDRADLTGPVVTTDDTLVALGDLARHHRRRFTGPVVAVGGSMGKTTTKEMLVAILRAGRPVLATVANNNNRVGVPLTLLQAGPHHDAVVLEVGTNRPGEIAELARIVEPTHAVLTNIAEEHLEHLGDLDGVAREETALLDDARARGATALVNLDDPRLAAWAAALGGATPGPAGFTMVGFGTSAVATVRGAIALQADATATLTVQGRPIALRTLGPGMARNALAATATALTVGAPINDVVAALEAWEPPLDAAGYARMRLETRNGRRILVDCYNAGPAGMGEALDVLRMLPLGPTGRRIAVLGDMLELGAAAPARHRELVARLVADPSLHRVHLVGPECTAAVEAVPGADGDPRLVCHRDAPECLDALHDEHRDGDVLLVKASHGIGLERVVLGLFDQLG